MTSLKHIVSSDSYRDESGNPAAGKAGKEGEVRSLLNNFAKKII